MCIWKGTTTTNHVRVKSLGVANVQPWAMQFANAPPPDQQGGQMPCCNPGGGMGTSGIG